MQKINKEKNMEELLTFLVKALVEKDDEVKVEKEEEETSITYHVKVDSDDLGKVIGKGGKTANSIRTVMKSIGAKTHKKVFVKFED